jgi:histone deacetylase complex regulatory component SIN3
VKRTTPQETYDRFKGSLTDSHRARKSAAEFKTDIRDMFRQHPVIIINFNKFMAKYYKVARAF